MNNTQPFTLATFLISFLLILSSCGSGGPDLSDSDFDRALMIQNYGNNVILPSYNALQERVDDLQSSITDFSENPTTENLSSAQEELKQARLAWQDANLFQFGPAESNALRTSVNTFPADTDQIESNIDSGDYTLGTLSNTAAAGFPTLGYLLHGIGNSDEEIVSQYVDDSNAENRTQYLQDNITFIKNNIDNVVTEWGSNGGDFISTFVSEENAGTDVGSSLGQLVNALVLHYERFIRDGKIGIPAGVRSAGVPRPEATEAFYAGYSVELAIANTRAAKRLFLGNNLNSEEGVGLDDNIEALDASELSDQIVTDFDEAIAALQNLNDPLSENIENNNEPVLDAFSELQNLVVLMKADMASILGVTITFQDNDGD